MRSKRFAIKRHDLTDLLNQLNCIPILTEVKIGIQYSQVRVWYSLFNKSINSFLLTTTV